ncbi:MAG: hypothetical protein ACRD00_06055 [Thermoanaerobaculia bacterium]
MKARRGAPAIVGAVLFAAATLGLFFVSRGKWSDALIDSGSEWSVPDALARGGLLYRDVVHWFGPFTPYFHSLFFRLLGSSFVTLAVAGAVAAVGVLFALFLVIRRLSGRSAALAWTALAVPALVFMPNAGGIFGMGHRVWHAAAFALAAVALAGRPRKRPGRAAFLAGCFAGLSGLCRTEWGLATCAAVVLVVALCAQPRSVAWQAVLAAGAGWAAVFGGGVGLFLFLAGPGPVIVDGHLLLTGLPPETRTFLVRFSGIGDWPRGLAQMAFSGATWLGTATAVALLSQGEAGRDSRRGRLVLLAGLFGVLAAAAAVGGGVGPVLFSAAPLVCAVALAAGVRRAPRPRAAQLAAIGLLGLLLSYRRPFHIGDSAYVAPPLLFAFGCAAALLTRAVARERAAVSRRRLVTGFGAGMALLIAAAFGGRFLQYAADERVPVRGTGGMLSARADEAAEIDRTAAAVRRGTSDHDGLVCFPEGQILNFLSGRSVPIRRDLFIPGYLTKQNEGEVLEDLARHPPAAVVIWKRQAGEYGEGLFGETYGRSVRDWIQREYAVHLLPGPKSNFDLAFRRAAAR